MLLCSYDRLVEHESRLLSGKLLKTPDIPYSTADWHLSDNFIMRRERKRRVTMAGYPKFLPFLSGHADSLAPENITIPPTCYIWRKGLFHPGES